MRKKSNTTTVPLKYLSESDGIVALTEIALDIRWSWNHATDMVWRQLDPVMWENTHNPWAVLQKVSREQILKKLSEKNFQENIHELLENRRINFKKFSWFADTHPTSPLKCIAYFSMEYMLTEALPIYSGGLGNVAGDQLKTASDLGIPMVGVGLLYQKGYFRQQINEDGKQEALYPMNDTDLMPITPLRAANGQWLRLEIILPGHSVWLKVWQAQVGHVKLYLLDSNDSANYPEYIGITSQLYGGDDELRLKQEMLLGIGGWRVLKTLGYTPDVCHLNEGHAAFVVLERAREYMQKTGLIFDVALAATRVGNLFTTHTAMPVGFDCFSPDLIKQYMSGYATQRLGISIENLLSMGRLNPSDKNEKFNMAYLAIRGSGYVNGVSVLHGKVSRHLFEPLFPNWPEVEIPVGHITNGVHMPSWDSVAADALWTESCGKDRWMGDLQALGQNIRVIPDEKLWNFRMDASKILFQYTRSRITKQLIFTGASVEEIGAVSHLFDPNCLTIGFARRFTAYKRPNLLLHDPDRLIQILTHATRPVQLIIAGKAHPKDKVGQQLIAQWMDFIRRPEVRSHVAFLVDYDMQLTEQLVQGVDVWINTPKYPWEACGTSGMKVLVNGGMNLSELDGWWAEAYAPELGWAIGDGLSHEDDLSWDGKEAELLYERLEQEIIPEFYTRNEENFPVAWLARMRESMARLTPHFSANRSVREYTERYYLPAAQAYHLRIAENGNYALKMVEWYKEIVDKWSAVSFGKILVKSSLGQHVFEVALNLNGLDPKAVRVELFADGFLGSPPVHHEMTSIHQDLELKAEYIYIVTVYSSRSTNDYTARVIPFFEGANIPLEGNQILWQR